MFDWFGCVFIIFLNRNSPMKETIDELNKNIDFIEEEVNKENLVYDENEKNETLI